MHGVSQGLMLVHGASQFPELRGYTGMVDRVIDKYISFFWHASQAAGEQLHALVDTRADMRIDMCIDMCPDMCEDMCLTMCFYMHPKLWSSGCTCWSLPVQICV